MNKPTKRRVWAITDAGECFWYVARYDMDWYALSGTEGPAVAMEDEWEELTLWASYRDELPRGVRTLGTEQPDGTWVVVATAAEFAGRCPLGALMATAY